MKEKNKSIILIVAIILIICVVIGILFILKKTEVEDKQLSLNGKYSYNVTTNQGVHESNIIIKNQTDSTIEFSIDTIHGINIDHVNMGEVSGTAKKIENNKFEFEETFNGDKSKITFSFKEDKTVNVTEEYSNNMNPYAGQGVYFAGDYKRVD